jgi:hypothetical protein
MSTRYWKGSSANVRSTYTCTIALTWAAGDTITVTIDNVAFLVTIGSLVTTAQVATTLKQAFNGEALTDTTALATINATDGGAKAIPQFSEITASVSGSVVTFTTNQSSPYAWLIGKPFSMTTGDTGTTAGNGTATFAAGTTGTSQAHWDQPDNWSANTVPVDGDTVIFDAGSVDLRWNMTAAIQVAGLTKYKSYTGNVGLLPFNADNSSKNYSEFRTPTYLTFDDDAGTAATVVNLETGEGQGSGLFMLDTGAGETTLNLFGKGNRLNTNIPCILWKGSVGTAINNLAGDLGIAFLANETATVTTLRNGDGPTSQAKTICGSGLTLTTAICNGGTLSTNSAITTANMYGGAWQHNSGTITALNVYGGAFYPIGGATITTLTIGSGGSVDCSRGSAAFAVTNTIQLYKNSSYTDLSGRSGNVVFKLNNCTLADVKIQLAPNKTYTLS